MNFLFICAISLVAPVVLLIRDQKAETVILATIAFGVGIVFPVVVALLLRFWKIQNALPAFLIILLALFTSSLAYPMFANFPVGSEWVLFSFLATSGVYLVYRYQNEVGFQIEKTTSYQKNLKETKSIIKVLDTSIIIDGRILDIASTDFIEGPFIVPNFVLREIQLISDSSDPIKRNRGRRGLDMLNQLQKHDGLEVRISYKDYTETREVDAKLVKLAADLNARLVTNDFNLNKVAELQGVRVLNINTLVNALKPVVLPGEEMEIQVVKEGKDENQGIGYLDDGTMVVIENGGKLVGKKINTSVTSVIQTNAGKMIFTKMLKN